MKWLQGLLKESKEGEGSTPMSSDSSAVVEENPPAVDSPPPAAEAALLDPALAAPVVPDVSEQGLTPEAVPVIDLAPLLGRLEEVGTRQNDLLQLFESRLKSDDVQGKMMERLHDELQQHKSNFVRQAMTPLLKEVIFCHDFAVQQGDKLRNGGQEESGVAALEALRQMLVDVLFKFDVEPYRGEDEVETTSGTTVLSPSFDPRTQQCLRTLPTDQPELDKRIASRGACGFRSGEAILRRELVSVYKYSGSPRPAAGEPASTGSLPAS
jgi:hypothetical protein